LIVLFDIINFVNFNTVQEMSWEFQQGKKYTRTFRVFVYDGSMTTEDAEKMWQKYSAAAK